MLLLMSTTFKQYSVRPRFHTFRTGESERAEFLCMTELFKLPVIIKALCESFL